MATASLRKAMVLRVALDRVAAGDCDLDDPVVVSAAAADVNGKADAMGLVEGETLSLRNLLYGMMMVSAGDATWAVSELLGGSVQDMVQLMDNKAFDLGLTNTTHCQEGTAFSGVSYSTARDQSRLWGESRDVEHFLEMAGKASAVICGTRSNGTDICHPLDGTPMTKSLTQYPELDGWKTGGNGGTCKGYEDLGACPSGGCLTAQTTRLERTLISTQLHPTSPAPSRWDDAKSLFNWGFRQLFTPDYRGESGNQGGAALDFGLDAVGERHAVTATITAGNALTLCNWEPQADLSVVVKRGCASRILGGFLPGIAATVPTRLTLVPVTNIEAESDYLLGRLDSNGLVLKLWRVGQRNF